MKTPAGLDLETLGLLSTLNLHLPAVFAQGTAPANDSCDARFVICDPPGRAGNARGAPTTSLLDANNALSAAALRFGCREFTQAPTPADFAS